MFFPFFHHTNVNNANSCTTSCGTSEISASGNELGKESAQKTVHLPRRTPAISYVSHDHGDEVTFAIPGIAPENVRLSLSDSVLTVRGVTKNDAQAAHGIDEFDYAFSRQFSLSDVVDGAAITATCKHGILKITLPRKKSAQPRQIPIQVA
jgi:HSP20 family protein